MAESYDSLWEEINRCDVCKNDERIELNIRDCWNQEAFFPFRGVDPEPPGLPVRYLLVAQEPSTGWTKGMSPVEARAKVGDGSIKNFNITGGDFAIRWAAHNWLVNKGEEAFLLTDLAKCSVAGDEVNDTRPRRYRNCRRFLTREVESFLSTLRAIVPVGKEAYRWCIATAEPNWPPVTKAVPHYAWRFARSALKGMNNEGLPSEAEFAEFVKDRNPTSRARLHERELNILSVYKGQFAEIKLLAERRDREKG